MSRPIAVFLLLFLILDSCQKKQESPYQENLLIETYGDLMDGNLRVIGSLEAIVNEKGRRQADVEVLDAAKGILEKRDDLDVPFDFDEPPESARFGRLNEYIAYLDSLKNTGNFRIKNDYWSSHVNAITYFQEQLSIEANGIAALNLAINLSYLERELIDGLSHKVGVYDHFGVNFIYNFNADTVKIGEEFELVISPDENNFSSALSYDYANPQVVVNGNEVEEFDLKIIGAAAVMKFTPKEAGVYQIQALFKSTLKYGNYVYEQPAAVDLVVVE